MSTIEEAIEFLVSRRFPGTNAPPAPDAPPEHHDQWKRGQEEMTAMRAELRQLSLEQLLEQMLAHAKEIEEQQADQPQIGAELQVPAFALQDVAFWMRKGEWPLLDGALVLHEIEPWSAVGIEVKRVIRGYDSRLVSHHGKPDRDQEWRAYLQSLHVSNTAKQLINSVREIRDNARIAARHRRLRISGDENVIPRHFLVWADSVPYSIPPTLAPLMQDRHDVKQLSTQLAEKDEEIGKLYERITELQNKPGRWPWGEYETHLLKVLAEAVREHWVDYNPAKPKSAPKSENVERWLTDRGTSQRVAEVIAQIIRPDDLKVGPRS